MLNKISDSDFDSDSDSINDLPLASNVFDMMMYADDTALYCNIN